MNHSEQMDLLTKALVEIQKEVPAIPKDADNPFFKSKYADLASVVQAAQPIVATHGIAVSQDPEFDGQYDLLTTTLLHVSGQWKSATMRLYLTKSDPQGQGSAITYAKRYAYMAALNLVAEEDDDGNAASKPVTQPRREQHSTVRQSPRSDAAPDSGEIASEKQVGMMSKLFAERGYDEREVRLAYTTHVIGREVTTSKDMTKREASKVIEALMAEPAQEAR